MKRFKLLITLIVISTLLFFLNDYIKNLLPGALWSLSGTPKEQQTKELVKEVIIKKGDNFNAILTGQKLPTADIVNLVKLMNSEKSISTLKIGRVFKFFYDTELIEQPENELVEEKPILNRVVTKQDNNNSIEFVRQGNNFVIHKITTPLQKVIVRYDALIDSSVISALKKAGLPTNIIISLIKAYSHQIDMQRQIRSGDTISVLVEKFITEDGKLSHYDNIRYTSLVSRGKNYNMYLYSPSGTKNDKIFFTEQGESIKSSLLKTPIDVIRISSHYGYRKKHPVLGYGAMHKGVDFAASIGTPIYASGDGKIQFIGWKSGYGRFVLIKHSNGISTAYAHASKFANNLKAGMFVKQGQVIAYVGNSGHATGPHLHYEIRVNGQQVNPLKFKSMPGIKLTGENLARFNEFKKKISVLNRQLTQTSQISAQGL